VFTEKGGNSGIRPNKIFPKTREHQKNATRTGNSIEFWATEFEENPPYLQYIRKPPITTTQKTEAVQFPLCFFSLQTRVGAAAKVTKGVIPGTSVSLDCF
jgi:hypothetical protein